MLDYRIAIPSYKRPEILKKATLATLQSLGVDPARIVIFVASEAEREAYEAVLGHSYEIVVGVLGKVHQQRFYHGWFPIGTPLLNLDDDIYGIKQKADSKLEDYAGTIDELVEFAFSVCEKYGAKLWGINPVANGFYMNDRVSVGLRFICGNFYGNYAGDPAIVGENREYLGSSGDDWETTLQSFINNGRVVRVEWLCPVTKMFAQGGIDAQLKEQGIADRQSDNTEALAGIVSRYPLLTSLYTKAGGVTNIRLRPLTEAKIPR